jgi:hypothetical protein
MNLMQIEADLSKQLHDGGEDALQEWMEAREISGEELAQVSYEAAALLTDQIEDEARESGGSPHVIDPVPIVGGMYASGFRLGYEAAARKFAGDPR